MGFRKTLFFLFVFFQLGEANTQIDTKNIVPLSPNAAAIARYGEVPVSQYTGIPQITIPLYTIGGKKIGLPIQLSYHAGGNKVESIASWVGLGWSLGSMPSISRSINGIADESPGGFISLFASKTLKQLYEIERPQNSQTWYNFNLSVARKEADTEADIFYYSLPGKSGKFFYSQEEQKFLTYPRTEIKISYNSSGFLIVDEDGTKYYFDEKETQSSASYFQSTPVTTTWNITLIKDANETENISFEYDLETHVYNSNKGSVRYFNYSGINTRRLNGYTFPISQNSSLTQRLKTIIFKGGYVEFFPEQTTREDFNGAYALKEIGVYDFSNTLVKKYSFRYKYLQGGGFSGSPQNQQDLKWLFLEGVDEVSKNQNTDKLTHTFQYNEIVPPSRNSFAQDYWGYYNGANSNQSLIPLTPLIMPGSNTPVMVGDANRQINADYNQFGILQKILYPTGGSTEFEYESNKIPLSQNEIFYKSESESIEASGQTNVSHFVSNTFTINNPPDLRLNGDNLNGGAFISIEAGYFGCDLSGGASPCANISLNGQSSDGTNLYRPIWANSPNNTADFGHVYIPNGTYKLEAIFSQDPAAWDNFYVIADWEAVDNSPLINYKLAPGLRVKSIKTRPNPNSNFLIKKLKYINDLNNPVSHSGKMLYKSDLVYHRDLFAYCEPDEVSNGVVGGSYIKLSSYSNFPAVSHNGSSVGYSSVFTETSENGQTGFSQHLFENVQDYVNNVFPYAPAPSREHLRGLNREEKLFKNSGGNNLKVKEINNKYLELDASNVKHGYNIKADFFIDYPNPDPQFPIAPDVWVPYEVYSTKTENNNILVIEYDQDSEQKNIIQETSKTFDLNLFNIISQETKNSKGEVVKQSFNYPGDYSTTPVMVDMIQKNMLKDVVQYTNVNVTKNNIELSKTKTNYQYWQNNTIIEPSSVEKSIEGNVLETEVVVNAYDNKGNILQITGKDGVIISYLYGYNSQYPVAKITGSSYATASSYITQSVLDGATGNGDDASLRSHLNNLRNIPGTFVTTYTYKPLVGITSETDPRGKTVYYEYDGFNRLSLIRDQDNNIIKKICYNYAGQVENCAGTNTTAAWQSTGQVRCKPCPSNTAYTTNMQQHEEKDTNPNSSSYNTTRWVDDNVAGSCTASPSWQNVGTPVCQTSGGNNTGYVEQQQKDMNPCSATYNQTQTITTYNTAQCPPPTGCTEATCTGNDKKCINGVCETGTWGVISSADYGYGWTCTYAYCFSDGTYSAYTQDVPSSGPCMISCEQFPIE